MSIGTRMATTAAPRYKAGAMTTRRHDLRHSLLTLALGVVLGVLTTRLVLAGAVALPTALPSTRRFAVEVALYVGLFDAYFYALHRLLHTRALYRRVHAVHHRSAAPTALTALAFHPLEALLIMGFLPVSMWLLPIHLLSFAVVSVFLSASIVLAHTGREILPPWTRRVPLLASYVTPRLHDAHHLRRDCNYAATFSFLDRLFGTLREDVTRPTRRA